MSLDLIQKLDQLVPNPTCVYDVLNPILYSCEIPEDVKERTKISVGLSLCEFAAAHVDFPQICLDSTKLEECTIQLESRTTWWTTFSGNYRHISVICQEYRPHFEAKKFMRTFKNAAELFNTYQREMETYAKDFDTQRFQMSHEWDNVVTDLNTRLTTATTQIDVLKTEIDKLIFTYGNELQSISSLANGALEQIYEASIQIQVTASKSQELMMYIDDFKSQMNEITQSNIQNAVILSNATQRAEMVLNRTGRVLECYNSVVALFAKLFLKIVPLSMPLIIFLLFWVIYRRWKSKKPKDSFKYSDDWTFY